MDIRVGTSGWSYDAWKHGFYEGVPRRRWLAHYAAHFDAVEVNATFYGALAPATLRAWRAATPPGFVFCIKASRFLTHIRRLDFDRASLDRLRRQGDALAGKLGVVLWQLPQDLKRDDALLDRFLGRLRHWKSARHAVEFRSRDWFCEPVAGRLDAAGFAIVQSHAPDWPMWERVAGDFVYLRLHGGQRLYRSAYATTTLGRWAKRIRRWQSEGRSVHVYFDNTDQGNAVRNAMKLNELVGMQRQHHLC